MPRLVITILLVVCLVASSSWAQDSSQTGGEDSTKTVIVRMDSNLVLTPEAGDDPLTFRLRNNTARPLSAYLSTSNDIFFGYKRVKLSRLECAWEGAGVGMTLGMIAGAAGMTSGMFDEDASWYVIGAAAALGALFGTMKADDPKFNVQIRWEPSDYDRR